jgi:hypothetical protein
VGRLIGCFLVKICIKMKWGEVTEEVPNCPLIN